MSLPDQYSETLLDMADCIRQRLSLSLPAVQAEPLTLDIIETIRSRFEGGLIYIPKGRFFKIAQRNKAILAEFDGHNHRALAIRYGLSIVTIYDIISDHRKKTLTDSSES